MKFVVVNHEPASGGSACSSCSRPLGSGYIRHVPTQQRYCDYDCYRRAGALSMTWSMLWPITPRTTHGLAAAYSNSIEIVAVLSAVSCFSYAMQMWTLSRSLADAFLGANDHERR